MTPSPPDEVLHFRGKTLTPESPRPIYIPEPSNFPVLLNQMDPVFNDTSTYGNVETRDESPQGPEPATSHPSSTPLSGHEHDAHERGDLTAPSVVVLAQHSGSYRSMYLDEKKKITEILITQSFHFYPLAYRCTSIPSCLFRDALFSKNRRTVL